jgi:hypothetical protein
MWETPHIFRKNESIPTCKRSTRRFLEKQDFLARDISAAFTHHQALVDPMDFTTRCLEVDKR